MSTEFPLSGQIIGDEHHLPVRIYYEDTDFSGVVYHANYLKYFERGRSEYMRLLGVHHHQLAALDEPLAFAVSDIRIKYRAPVRIDDLVVVKSRLLSARGASFVIQQWIERDGLCVADGEVTVVCIDLKGRPRRMAKPLLDAIKPQVSVRKAL
ncbi:hypothetical protein AEAC466_12660 [Asticcacaulis sp. AC466]|uniref:tol-pal system-associated acyl-CoA thioesterase n=1 Tax=Asticcacaulis sp. AC466 TaxID=1282362 RepID=UPI0003C3DE8D|nr:tol-pal system-associated acyl-CoA thioesterase [Asticcacaulis sp. AC466]ESQ83521.1 hypothetical protein AEAC466_12660 [Asticcacaulis sp. AC466]